PGPRKSFFSSSFSSPGRLEPLGNFLGSSPRQTIPQECVQARRETGLFPLGAGAAPPYSLLPESLLLFLSARGQDATPSPGVATLGFCKKRGRGRRRENPRHPPRRSSQRTTDSRLECCLPAHLGRHVAGLPQLFFLLDDDARRDHQEQAVGLAAVADVP